MVQTSIPQAMDLAVQHHRAGRLADAESIYRQILTAQPTHAASLHMLGLIQHQRGQTLQGIELIRQALAIMPNLAEAHVNIAMMLVACRDFSAALFHSRKAIELAPNTAYAYFHMGNALDGQGDHAAAAAAHERAEALNPGWVEALNNKGVALWNSGRQEDGIATWRRAVELNPRSAIAHNNLAVGLCRAGRVAQSIVEYQRAIELDPDNAMRHTRLGIALHELGHFDEAIAAHQRAIAIDPYGADAFTNSGNVLKDLGQIDASLAAHRRALELKPASHKVHSNLLMAMHYAPAHLPPAISEEHKRWDQQHGQRHSQWPHRNSRDPHRPIRVGYVSPDFRRHPVTRFILPLLSNHDARQVEVFAYYNSPATDAVTSEVQKLVPHFRNVPALSDDQLAALISKDQIDILVDLAGHTANNRLLTFARKPAPIQVTYLGYPNTTGLGAMDYRLTDAFADPPGTTEGLHTERLVRLQPSAWCYRPSDAPPVAPRNPEPLTLGCFNTLAKVNVPLLQLWFNLLREMPEARLLLKAPGLSSAAARQWIVQQAATSGIAAHRVELLAAVQTPHEHLELYGRLDIALDTFPYHGTTTTLEALWMGVPVVTLAGATHVSRVGVSLLNNAGHGEWVAQTPEQYAAIVRQLAGDPQNLQSLRPSLRPALQDSPLMNEARFARQIEAAFRTMWQNWCSGGGTALR